MQPTTSAFLTQLADLCERYGASLQCGVMDDGIHAYVGDDKVCVGHEVVGGIRGLLARESIQRDMESRKAL